MKEKKIIEFRMVDDACVVCGEHAHLGGGHLFRGYSLADEWYIDEHGWLCNGEIWICLVCQWKLRRILELSEKFPFNRRK